MRKNKLFTITIFLITISFVVSTIISINTINTVINKENKNMATLIADNIYDDIYMELQRHIVAGRTMASNRELIELIKHEDEYTRAEMEEILKQDLARYSETLDSNTAFVVSSKSGCYYTQDGFNKIVQPGIDDHDVWYSIFLEKNEECDFDIDIDEAHGYIWTVFVNVRMLDDEGNLIGVCGIGTQMADMQSMLLDMKNTYDIEVNIVDDNGVVQVDIDDINIESQYGISLEHSDSEIHYKSTDDGYIITKYMPDLGWTLVIQRHINMFEIMLNLVAKNFLVMITIFIALTIASSFIIRKSSKIMEETVQLSSYGSLAGVYAGMYKIDIKKNSVKEIKNVLDNVKLFDESKPVAGQFDGIVDKWIETDAQENVREFFNIDTMLDRLSEKESIYSEFIIKTLGWCRARFIVAKEENSKKVDHIIFAIEVIDKEKRKQEKLRHETEVAKAASEAKGRFLANMSHEIRTPINAVLGMDTMILRETTDPNIREYATNIQDAGNTLLTIINDILDITKIESGKMEIVPVDYDLSSLIHDVANMMNVKAEAKGLILNVEVDENLPSGLFGDDIRIRQILLNLISNAVKYTEKGSVALKVTGDISGDEICLHYSIKDTGIGIKEEDMGKLFAEFERIEESRNKNIEGTGLGMSITAQLLSLMGSKLGVKSKYGEGSEFYFDLIQKIDRLNPIGNLSKRIAEKKKDYDYSVSFVAPTAKVLVVDDNNMNRKVFAKLLSATQVQVDDADGGESGLQKIMNNKYDVIFLDHMMPGMDGIEVLKEMKKSGSHPNTDTPVVALTANAIMGAREEYIEAGFDSYLSKPIIPEKLEQMLFELLPKEKVSKAQGAK